MECEQLLYPRENFHLSCLVLIHFPRAVDIWVTLSGLKLTTAAEWFCVGRHLLEMREHQTNIPLLSSRSSSHLPRAVNNWLILVLAYSIYNVEHVNAIVFFTHCRWANTQWNFRQTNWFVTYPRRCRWARMWEVHLTDKAVLKLHNSLTSDEQFLWKGFVNKCMETKFRNMYSASALFMFLADRQQLLLQVCLSAFIDIKAVA